MKAGAAGAAFLMLAQCMSTAPNTVTASTTVAPVSAAPTSTADIGGLLNSFRSANGRSGLSPDPRLNQAAAVHAADMGNNGFTGHTGSNGSEMRDRVRAQGFSACYLAENVAKGQRSVGEVMASWEASAGHRKNMLNPKPTVYGFAQGPANSWVLVLAQPGC